MKRSLLLPAFAAAIWFAYASAAFAQSTSQDFPTAIASNEVSSTIKARDLGDSRLTTYYYWLNGDQGDLFLNLVTRNFTGDIDVFTANGLRPMTKIVVYADFAENETGRAIYLRKPEKLLLRIQGRTPNDEPASFRLKFAGSFVAARAEEVTAAPEMPKVNAELTGAVRVNSVGTILPPPPKPVEPVAEKEKPEAEPVKTEISEETKTAENLKDEPSEESKSKVALVVNDPLATEKAGETAASKRSSTARRRPSPKRTRPEKPAAKRETETVAEAEKVEVESPPETEKPKNVNPVKTETPSFRTLTNNRKSRAPKKDAEPKPDPLASINLVIQFKDGNSLERKMSEVFKFSVDKGVLTVVLKDGSISRYQIVDVAKVTIE